jgi:hypothetical protein
LNNVVNQATMSNEERIAVRTAEQNRWNAINGSGPADQAGANADAAKGPIERRNPFGGVTIGGVNLGTPLLILAVVAVGWFLLRKR